MDIALIVAVPFLMALFIATPALNRLLPKDVRTWAGTIIMLVLFAALIGYFPYIQVPEGDTKGLVVTRIIEWVPEIGLTLTWYLDALALLFGLIVTGIGAGIFLYAGYYFDDAKEQSRFLLWLSAFAGAMLGLVLSGNLLTMFIMWELTSVTSYMLIGFKGSKSESARFGAQQAFLVTGAGALALIVGLVLLAAAAGQTLDGGFVFELSEILSLNLAEHPYYTAFAILIMIGAFTKSAQFPFHFWLPGAMEAPTPASSFLHSATMVKAGIYLLARLYPPMHENPLWTGILVVFGLFTMLLGAFFALGKRDLKGLLAYSTVSMLGAFVALIGLPEYSGLKAAFVGILAHALYKAALFLVVGTVDHNTGTRIIDKLGGLRRYMPGMTIVAIISGLSMAGLFPLFGFVAKEILLDAFVNASFDGATIALAVVTLSSLFTVIAGFIVIWDVFFKAPKEEIHYHASPVWLTVAPGAMALGSALFGFLIVPLIFPLINAAVPKSFSLYLLPPNFWELLAFWLSTGAIVFGLVLFLVRGAWIPLTNWRFVPSGTGSFRVILAAINWIGDQSVKLQGGLLRYYLVGILGVVAIVILGSGQLNGLARVNPIVLDNINGSTLLRAILLLLIIAAAFLSVLVRRHITAALALGVMGYAVAGIFLLYPAPDVALVQILVETLATVLIVLILSRLSEEQRKAIMGKLWKGRTNFRNINLGIFRDIFIAAAVGFAVFLFALTALANRPEPELVAASEFCQLDGVFQADPNGVRSSIARYHLCTTEEALEVTDVVGAIVADFRGMDTFVEIAVFAVAALGVLTLLSRGLDSNRPFVPKEQNVYYHKSEFEASSLETVREHKSLDTPFTRLVMRIVLPLGFLLALAHIINGSGAPGDGFTAGAITGLVTALWYVVLGYDEARSRLGTFSPVWLMRAGLLLAVINALVPLLVQPDTGAMLGYIDYGKMIGIDTTLQNFGLKFTSTIIFELGIALTVFGGSGVIMETVAHPQQTKGLDDAA